MVLFIIQLARFITRTVVVVALTAACLNSTFAQAQELTAQQPSAAENDSAAVRDSDAMEYGHISERTAAACNFLSV